MPAISGLHHVTALGGDAARNVAFYTRLLGLRLVKKTVNFDDPGTYHLYYGDEAGRPGTVLTFFPWPLAAAGQRGAGQVTAATLRVPAGSLGWWRERLRGAGVVAEEAPASFGEERLRLLDPDGLELLLVGAEPSTDEPAPWARVVPPEHAVRTVDAVLLASAQPKATSRLLGDVLGLARVGEEGDRERFAGADGSRVDLLLEAPPQGRIAAGSVHHVAFRTPDDGSQAAWRALLLERGLHVSPVMDREYFRSIYFREPGGILFEIATDGPGFARDEPLASLGADLKLPPWLEPHRARIAAALPPLDAKDVYTAGAA